MFKTVALFCAMALACSASVTYTLTATASGSLDGNPFTSSLLTITAVASSATPGVPSSVTVVVGSVSDSFNLESPYVFAESGTCHIEPPLTSCAGFGTGVEDIMDISNNSFAAYTLGNSIGPVADA